MQKDWMTVSGWLFGVGIPLVVGAKIIMRRIKQQAHRGTPEYEREIKERKRIIQHTSEFDLASSRSRGEYPFDIPETRGYRPKRGLF
jgi:hypothetical protein